MRKTPEALDRYRGCLVGLASGTPWVQLGIQPPGTFEPIMTWLAGEPSPPAGEWTDDTAMALCLADSPITKQGSTRWTSFSGMSLGGGRAT